MLMIAWKLSGFTSIPQLVSINPKNFPACTPNVHLSGFKLILYPQIDVNVSLSPQHASDLLGFFTTISSTHTSRFHLIWERTRCPSVSSR